MILEWIWAGLYFLSAVLLFLSIKNFPKLKKLCWKTPFDTAKISLYFILSACSFLSAHELSSFYTVQQQHPILEIHIDQVDTQIYQVSLSSIAKNSTNKSTKYLVYGDMWQIDLKVLTWNTFLSYFGVEPLYSLERLNGRYEIIEEELSKERSIYSLNPDQLTDVAWPYLLTILEVTLVRSFYGASVYAPMAQDAKFAIYLTDTGIELMPQNQAAKKSLKSW